MLDPGSSNVGEPIEQPQPTKIEQKIKWFYDNHIFESVNLTNLIIIAICGIALVLTIVNHQTDIASVLGGGLLGYLGKSTNNSK